MAKHCTLKNSKVLSAKILFKAEELEGENCISNSRNTNKSATYEIIQNTRYVNETSVNLIQ